MQENVQDKTQELETQMERAGVFTHQELATLSAQLHDTATFVYGLIDYLTEKGMVVPDELKSVIASVKSEMEERNVQHKPQIFIRDDSKTGAEYTPVDCETRRPVCKSICCKLNFPLTQVEIEAGHIKWDLGRPYHIRKQKNGFCTHFEMEKRCCGVYENRPGICRRYTCANDNRIWKDFDNMILNHEWLQANLDIPLNSDEITPAMVNE